MDLPQSKSRTSIETLVQWMLKLNLIRISSLLSLSLIHKYFVTFLDNSITFKKKKRLELLVSKISLCYLYLKKALWILKNWLIIAKSEKKYMSRRHRGAISYMPNVMLSNVYYQEQPLSHLQGKETLQRQANDSQAAYNISQYMKLQQ